MRDVAVADLLAERGLHGASADTARTLLEGAGLVNPRKERVAESKIAQVRDLLDARLFPVCSSPVCGAEAATLAAGRTTVHVAKPRCAVCNGSDNRLAVDRMALAMRRAGRSRLLVLGGTPATRDTLGALMRAHGLEARFVLEDDRRNEKAAAADVRWADGLMVVWGSTPIPHKTTELYRPYGPLLAPRRSITALADQVTTRLSGAAPRGASGT